jgi:hypothetical protein
MGSRDNGEHTDEQGWTTIEANGSRKPKTNNREHTFIDSIISSINIETTTVTKGAPEARMESPTRERRCTLPDRIDSDKEIEFCITKKSKQQLKPPKSPEIVDEDEEKKEEDVVKKIAIKQRKKKNNQETRTRSSTTRNNDDMKEEGRNKENKKKSSTNEQEREKETKTTTMAMNG